MCVDDWFSKIRSHIQYTSYHFCVSVQILYLYVHLIVISQVCIYNSSMHTPEMIFSLKHVLYVHGSCTHVTHAYVHYSVELYDYKKLAM